MKRMKKSQGILVLCIMIAIIGFFGWYTYGVVKATRTGESDSIKLGLDLSGGVSITYEVKGDTPTDSEMEDTIQKLRSRIENDLEGNTTTEANVYKVGSKRIAVEIPGVKDANAILEQLGTPGNLYFIRQNGSDGTPNYTAGADGEYVLAEGKTIESLEEDGSIVVSGTDIKTAEAGFEKGDVSGKKPVVDLTLDKKGTKAFAEATTDAAPKGETIGIYYDGRFVSVPRVNEPIEGGQAQISGSKDIEEAKKLASYIRIGGLDIELQEMSSEVVGASLGTNALSTSLMAGLAGLVIVILFMIFVYRIMGVAAALALVFYTEMIICVLYWFDGITLTLPGIAGIILSIGMAVDANAIIFTRTKEEIGNGHSVASSIESGFHKAMSAILDGNITTLIAAAVLGFIGTGTVKGFAITLAIGVILSMFTALFITKLLLRALYAAGAKSEKMYGKVQNRKMLQFMKKRIVFFAISLLVIGAGIVAMVVNQAMGNKTLAYSLEFAGGTKTTVMMDKNYTVEEINDEIVPIVSDAIKSNDITAQAVDQDNSVVIKTKKLSLEERTAIEKEFVDKLGVKKEDISTQNISAAIGSEMRRTSLIAVLVTVVLMLLYIWFRFKDIRFGSSAVLALAHDVLVTLAMYALFRLSVGNAFIACVLTVIGYSINDTIVIFDRIRENMGAQPNDGKGLNAEEVEKLADRSISETLTRSLSTSFTTAVMVLMLLILGVSSIREFAFPLLVGVICGTYSSICIATELWFIMKKRAKKAAR